MSHDELAAETLEAALQRADSIAEDKEREDKRLEMLQIRSTLPSDAIELEQFCRSSSSGLLEVANSC